MACPVIEVSSYLRDPTEEVSSLSHLTTETHPVPETLCSLVSRIPDDGRSPKTKQF
jgi:hypothetical protein